MNVHRSCHFAFLNNKIFELVYESTPTLRTPAREYADVRVKKDRGTLDIVHRVQLVGRIKFDHMDT